jgi:hypothetical protein
MRKIYIKTLPFISNLGLLLALMFIPFGNIHASVSPTLTLSNTTNGYTQMTVYADSNAPVVFYYNNSYNNTQTSNNIGYTNTSGYLTISLSNTEYNVMPRSYVYIMVNGIASQTVLWPNYYDYNNNYNNNYNDNNCYTYYNSNCGRSLTLSQNNVNLVAGQYKAITIYGSSNYYVYSNTNPYNVSASVTGNILNIYANNAGTSTLTICQSNLASNCSNVIVYVTNNVNNYRQAYVPHRTVNRFHKLPFHFSFNFMNRFTR